LLRLKTLLVGLYIVTTTPSYGQRYELKRQTIDSSVSFRAVSVPNDSVIWVSGSMGAIFKSIDGGKKFVRLKIEEDSTADFRSLYAFDHRNAVIANTGSPARIYLTTDGGANWDRVYENTKKEAFINGIDFWNENEGICFGDPVMGKMLILRTDDGGKSWRQMIMDSSPVMDDDEAAFAASGTTIRCYDTSRVMIATGGSLSRILLSENKSGTWKTIVVPIVQGEPSQGIFSLAFRNKNDGVIVGGDYKNHELANNHVYYTNDGGLTWHFPNMPTRGYRECVEYVGSDTLIAVGPTGIDVSVDGGRNWSALSDQTGLHVVRKARRGIKVFVAGKDGLFGEMIKTRR
jgi:photosystem II stability/assembly factor-like uncharacterized protein